MAYQNAVHFAGERLLTRLEQAEERQHQREEDLRPFAERWDRAGGDDGARSRSTSSSSRSDPIAIRGYHRRVGQRNGSGRRDEREMTPELAG